MSHKTKQFLWATVKILIVVIAGYFIYTKLQLADFDDLQDAFRDKSNLYMYSYITIIVCLSVVNWLLEIKKWQALTLFIKSLSFFESARQTLTAHLIGFITPAKAGDYGAKALFIQKEHQKKILFLNFLGNMYQLLATLFFGLLGVGFISFFTSGTAIFFWLMAAMMALLFYFILPRFLNRIKWSLGGYSWHKVRSFFKTIPKRIRHRARLLSFLRYLIFAHQFYLILLFLDISINYPFAMACITATYLLSSLVPVMQLLDVVVRGGVAVIIFGWHQVSEEIVLTTVFVMWLLNVALPLLAGGYFLLLPKWDFSQNTTDKSHFVQ